MACFFITASNLQCACQGSLLIYFWCDLNGLLQLCLPRVYTLEKAVPVLPMIGSTIRSANIITHCTMVRNDNEAGKNFFLCYR